MPKPRRPFSLKRTLRLTSVALLFTLAFAYLAISILSTFQLSTSPNRSLNGAKPADFGFTSYEEVSFQSAAPDQLTLRGWWMNHPGSDRALVMVHGQNSTRTDLMPVGKSLWDNGYSVLFFDLRGHGLSDGSFHTFGLKEQWDVVGAVRFVESRGLRAGRIGVMGSSMGASTALMAMGQSPDIGAGVADSAYADLGVLHGIFYPGMRLFTGLFRGYDLDDVKPIEAVKHLEGRPIFLIQGDLDHNVPVGEAYRLQQAAGPNLVKLWVLPGVGHASSYQAQPDEYVRLVTAFFDQNLK